MKTIVKHEFKVTSIVIVLGFFMMIFMGSSVRALGLTDEWVLTSTKMDLFIESIEKAKIDTEDMIVAVIDSGVDPSDSLFKDEKGKSRFILELDCNKDKCFVPDKVSDDIPGHQGTNAAAAIAQGTMSNVKIMSIKLLEDYDEEGNSMVYNAALRNAFRNILLLKHAGTLNIKVINISYKITKKTIL
jgi:hypothetical protein